MKRTLIVSMLGLAAITFTTATHAQKKPAKPASAGASGAGYQKVKTYDFSGDTIDGELVKPDGEFVSSRKDVVHSSLIRLRLDFIKEIVKSAEDL